jgi:hypothetical protein
MQTRPPGTALRGRRKNTGLFEPKHINMSNISYACAERENLTGHCDQSPYLLGFHWVLIVSSDLSLRSKELASGVSIM